MTINDAGLDIIKRHESCVLTAYKDIRGIWTIGWGHTPAFPGQTITQEQADDLLNADLLHAEYCVEGFVHVPLTENQFSALVSLVFNCGTGPLLHTLGAKLNEGDYQGAADEFPKWDHCNGVVVDGLLERCEEERTLFLEAQ